MANWAKLQEDLTGLKVVKRAKHGIHFDKGGGEVLANFVGKPCHFLDAGLWKPIDTKLLLLPDGYYGCPHSPVRVHKDGRVKVDGTNYTQYTELPSATGLVDGDRIVRTFSFGEQRMWVTEDGYRSEITLNRIPTLKEARKLIASESGTLSKEYLKSLTTATDANNDVHTFSTLSAFRTWLASAKFPVVIDPDFYATASGVFGDTCLTNSTSGAPDISYSNFGAAEYGDDTALVFLYRYDLSSIPSGSTISAAVFTFYKREAGSASSKTANIYKVADANNDWIPGTGNGTGYAPSGTPCFWAKKADGSGGITTAWAGSDGASTAGTDYVNTSYGSCTVKRGDADGTKYEITINASGLAEIATWCGAATNNGIMMNISGAVDKLYMTDTETTDYRPVLTVTYTAAGTFIPINLSANMQSLTGGMRG